MIGKLIKIIERPKGYVNIDEVYETLDGVDKEEGYEYDDYGEVLSKWATCDYGEVLDAISRCDVIQAISIDKVKQAREEMVTYIEPTISKWTSGFNNGASVCIEILDNLIAESEEK